MAISPPPMPSLLSQRQTANNFIALQSIQIPVTSTSISRSFTNLPGGGPVTMKITNTGNSGAYLAGCNSSAIVAAVSSITANAQPTAGTNAVSNCDYVAAGAILTQDYIAGTDTLSAICSGSNSTTLEVSIGYGQ